MPERDAFDARLAQAVHGLADHATTSVDAVDVAMQAMKRRPAPRLGPLRATLQVPVLAIVVAAVILSVVAWNMGSSQQAGVPMTPTAPPTASPSPSPSTSLGPLAPAHVAGTAVFSVQAAGSTSPVGGVDRTTGIVIATTDAADDPRASGTGLLRLSVDGSSTQGFATGSLHLDNLSGAWDGSCSGAVWDALPSGQLQCWLVGSGSYTGLTYYRSTRTTAEGAVLTGMIMSSTIPKPPEGP